jgi:uncharacterized SAM-binding protein YcdF (DUF218 family)
MFFVASKALWFLAAPVTLLILGAFVGALFLPGRAGFARALALACSGALLFASLAPVGALLLEPLEDRFPEPAADMAAPYGVIVLGGAIDDEASAARGQTIFDDGAARLTEAAILARRFPEARLIYTGGSSSLWNTRSSEAREARKLLVALGVAADRVEIEERSRNTDENARFTAALVHPHAARGGALPQGGFHRRRRSRRLSHAQRLARLEAPCRPGAQPRPARSRHSRMDRPCRLSGERADRPMVPGAVRAAHSTFGAPRR